MRLLCDHILIAAEPYKRQNYTSQLLYSPKYQWLCFPLDETAICSGNKLLLKSVKFVVVVDGDTTDNASDMDDDDDDDDDIPVYTIYI